MTGLDATPVINPHDAYVASVFRQIKEARGFFRGHLPERLAAQLNWRTLRLESSQFVTDDLGRHYADLVFSIELRGSSKRRRLRLLFEHKCDVRYSTTRQVLGYIIRQFEDTPPDEPLPPIVTVLLLQSGRWNRSAEFAEEYDLPEDVLAEFRPFLVNFQMVIVPLSELAEADITGTPEGRLALAVLKCVGESRPLDWTSCEDILSEICAENKEQLRRILLRAWSYLDSVVSREQESEIRTKLRSLPERFQSLEKTMVTLRQHWIEQGIDRGIERGIEQGIERGIEQGIDRGKEQGTIQILHRMLALAYPEFSEETSTVAGLSSRDRDRLLKAATSGKSWSEIQKLLKPKRS